MQQIAHQLEYRLIQRRIDTGAIGWAKWLEEDHHDDSDSDEDQQDCHNSSDDSDPIAGQYPNSPGLVALGQIIADTGRHTTNPAFEKAVQPVDELLVRGNEEVLADGCQAMGHHCVEEATRQSEVA